MATANTHQLTLDTLVNTTGAKDVGELPVGLGDLSGREQAFVAFLLRGQSLTDAWISAGYDGDREAAAKSASKAFAKPEVQRFYARCVAKVAANIDGVAARLTERSLWLHDIVQRQREAFEKADIRLTESELKAHKLHDSGATIGQQMQTIMGIQRAARSSAYEFYIKANREAEKHDTTVGAILGKIRLVAGGDGERPALQMTEHALQHFARWRDESAREAHSKMGGVN